MNKHVHINVSLCVHAYLWWYQYNHMRNMDIYIYNIYTIYINVFITNVNYIYVQQNVNWITCKADVMRWKGGGRVKKVAWIHCGVQFFFYFFFFFVLAIFPVIQVFVWKIFNRELLCVRKYIIYVYKTRCYFWWFASTFSTFS